jgi:hypothetical protein
MKRSLTSILLLTLLFLTFAIGETMDDLVERDGIYYKKFTDVPFTGTVTGKEQGLLEEDKKQCPWVSYTANGTVRHDLTGTFKNDVPFVQPTA